MLKGRQTGAMHRGHSWVFRAESHETMMSWYEDIESLIGKTGEARNAFVRRHVRSVSGMSTNSEVMEDDEADRTPYSADSVVMGQERPTSATRQPGGAFPSDVQIDGHHQAPLSPSSGDSSAGRDMIAAAGSYPDGDAITGSSRFYNNNRDPHIASPREVSGSPVDPSGQRISRHDSYYGNWNGPAAIVSNRREGQQMDSAAPDGREIRSDGDQASVAAMSGVIGISGRRESSAPPQVARRESVSTVPTNTNVTDHTSNTLATSIDDTHEPNSITGAGSPSLKDTFLPIAGASGSAKTGPDLSRPKQGSAVAIDMNIPGRFPPTNVAA